MAQDTQKSGARNLSAGGQAHREVMEGVGCVCGRACWWS